LEIKKKYTLKVGAGEKRERRGGETSGIRKSSDTKD